MEYDLANLAYFQKRLRTSLDNLLSKRQQIEICDLDEVEREEKSFAAQLKIINQSIKDNLFTTKLDKFFLLLEEIGCRIANIITNRGNPLVVEGNVFPSNSMPFTTLLNNPKSLALFTTKTIESIKKSEPQPSSEQEKNFENVKSRRRA